MRAIADRGGEVGEDSLGLLALGPRRLRLAVAELDDLERLDEERLARAGGVVDDALHAAPRARLQREHRPPAALRDEVLLQVLADARRAREPPQLLDDGVAETAQLLSKAAQEWRGVVAQVGAVVLDAAPDLLRERGEIGVDRRGDLVQERGLLRLGVERCARPRAAGDRRCDPAQRIRGEHAAARRVRRGVTHVVDPLERRLGGYLDERDRLAGQRLSARDLVRVGGGTSARASSSPRDVAVALASRSRIAGNSSASSACASTWRV